MGLGAVVSAGVGLAGGIMSSNAAKKAGDQQAASIQKGLDFQTGVYNDTSANLQPYIQGGTNALGALSQLYGLPQPGGGPPTGNALDAYAAFQKTPFYTFPLEQGQMAIERASAAKGLNLSPGTLGELSRYSAGYASQNFNSYVDALRQLGNLGAQAGANLGGVSNTAAGNVLQGSTNQGISQAAGTVGASNALQKGISNIPNLLGLGGNPSNGPFGSSYGTGGATGNNNWLGNGINNILSGYSWGGSTTLGGTPVVPGGGTPFA